MGTTVGGVVGTAARTTPMDAVAILAGVAGGLSSPADVDFNKSVNKQVQHGHSTVTARSQHGHSTAHPAPQGPPGSTKVRPPIASGHSPVATHGDRMATARSQHTAKSTVTARSQHTSLPHADARARTRSCDRRHDTARHGPRSQHGHSTITARARARTRGCDRRHDLKRREKINESSQENIRR